MIIEISGTIDQEAFGKVIKAYNELESNEPLEIYLNSSGGDPDTGAAILDVINSNDNTNPTTIIAYGKIFSAAFDLYYKAKCSKRILSGAMGMVHLSRLEMDKFDPMDNKDSANAAAYKIWWDNDKKERLGLYQSLGIEKKDLSKIKKGEDIYIQYNRLLELLNGKSNK